MRTTIENTRYRPKRFLTCRIPNLKLNYFVIDVHYKGAKFHSYSYLMFDLEVIIHDAGQQTTLTNTLTK